MANNPYAVFSREIWQDMFYVILTTNPAESSQEVLILMQLYPALEADFLEIKDTCVILQGLRVLFKHSSSAFIKSPQQLFALRVLNSTWCKAINFYLNSQSLDELPRFVCRHPLEFEYTAYGSGIHFIRKFMSDMALCPPSRNPFVMNQREILFKFGRGGLTSRQLQDQNTMEVHFINCLVFLDEAYKMVRTYGWHISRFKIEYDFCFYLHGNPILWGYIPMILGALPNLKILNINKHQSYFKPKPIGLPEDWSYTQYLNIPLPNLHFLDTLSIGFNSFTTAPTEVQLISNLIQRYASTLRTLQLLPSGIPTGEHSTCRFVTIPETVAFPHLGWLNYLEYRINCSSVAYIIDHLLNIKAPNLECLQLKTVSEFCNQAMVINTTQERKEWKLVLQKLKMFPLLTDLQINYCFQGGEDTLSSGEDSLDSVEILQMYHFTNATYKMLSCLPNLRHLSIIKAPRVPAPLRTTPPNFLEINIHKCFGPNQMYQSNIWRHLSELESINWFCAEDPQILGPIRSSFTRVAYNIFEVGRRRMRQRRRFMFRIYDCFGRSL